MPDQRCPVCNKDYWATGSLARCPRLTCSPKPLPKEPKRDLTQAEMDYIIGAKEESK